MKIKGYKGFDKNWKCQGFQFKVGEKFVYEGKLELCKTGFHFCEHPLDVLDYYSPNESKFAEIEAENISDQKDSDSKRVCSTIHINTEITIKSLVDAAIKFVFDSAKWTDKNTVDGKQEASRATGLSGAASATGESGAASATGESGAASATGLRGAASATGLRGAASATGLSGAASATGLSGAASATGERGAASATGWSEIGRAH